MLDDPANLRTLEGPESPKRSSWWDSHPYLEARLEALGQPGSADIGGRRPGAFLELLGSEPVLLARVAHTASPWHSMPATKGVKHQARVENKKTPMSTRHRHALITCLVLKPDLAHDHGF